MRRNLLIALGLILLTLAAYWRVTTAGFVDFDDPDYVTENHVIRQGLSWQNFVWAFKSLGVKNNWHPLAWLSHMLDVTMFGMNPLGHHLVNLGLHICNTLLWFVLWRRMTGAVWRSAMVAALFAVHPMHVESVAWVAERKDMLSTFLGLLTFLAYVRYTRRPAVARYLAVLGLFTLGLMAKPMLVTWPCIMLLLDYWPLARLWNTEEVSLPLLGRVPLAKPVPGSLTWEGTGKASATQDTGKANGTQGTGKASGTQGTGTASGTQGGARDTLRQIGILVLEKVPLLVLSAISSVLTYKAQHIGGALASAEAFPMDVRLENAIVGYWEYVRALFWPTNLAVFYPHPLRYPPLQLATAVAAILAITVIVAILAWRGRAYVAVGWFWFLGTLVPVIGLVQVGDQAMADRYSYISYIGLFVILVWAAAELIAPRPHGPKILAAGAAAILTACTILTAAQLRYWQDTTALLGHALVVSPLNPGAHTNLGALDWERSVKDTEAAQQCLAAGNKEEAERHLRDADEKQLRAMKHWVQAIEIQPRYADAYSNLGYALNCRGQSKEAEQNYRRAIAAIPRGTPARDNLGFLLLHQGKDAEAAEQFRVVLDYEPENVLGLRGMGVWSIRQNKLDDAVQYFQNALRFVPGDVPTLTCMGVVQLRQGKPDEAVAIFRHILDGLPPSSRKLDGILVTLAEVVGGRDAAALDALAAACAQNGNFPEALRFANDAWQIAQAQNNSALASAIETRIQSYRAGAAARTSKQ